MKSKYLMIALVIVLAGILIAGCDRPAPLPPTAATSTAQIPFPIPENPTLDTTQLGTQTAIAKTPLVITAAPTQGQGAVPQNTTVPVQPQPTNIPAPVFTSTPRPVFVVPSATPGRPSSYTIQAGDTFYCIARRFNLNVGDFLSLNGLRTSSFAQIGQTVKIPQSGSWSTGDRSLKSHPDTYTVASGDTLNKIACKYGDVDPGSILAANGMSSANDINVGASINIP